MLFRGRPVAGFDWVQRTDKAWYTPGDDDVYRRASPIDLGICHWTAGPRRLGVVAAERTYAAMQARRKDNGAEMSVSAQFVLSDDGVLTQIADLELCCVHADRQFNLRGIGIEYTMPGTEAWAAKIGKPEQGTPRKVAGSTVLATQPSPAALATLVRFADGLAALRGDDRYQINGRPLFNIARHAYTRRERFDLALMRSASGFAEHYHALGTEKVDAAGFFVDALAAAGWSSD